MTLSKNAIGNLLNRYKAVLSKCRILNTFGALAVAGMLVAGSAGMATATAQNWSDGSSHAVENFVDESGVRTSHYIDNSSTLEVIGNVTLTGASGQFVTMHVGENFSVTGSTGSGHLTVGGDVNVSYGGIQVNKGTLLVEGTFTTGLLGNITIGNGSNAGNATITGDLLINGGNNSVTRGVLHASDILITANGLRSGTTGQESVIIAENITLNGAGTYLDARYGDISTGTLTVTNGSIEVGSGDDDEVHGGKIIVNGVASFGTGSTLSIGNGVFDASGIGSLAIAADAGDVTIFNSGILKMDSADLGAIQKGLKVQTGGTVYVQGVTGNGTLAEYEALLQVEKSKLFDATTNQGILALEGYTFTDLTHLDQVGNQVGIALPHQTLGGGTLDAGAGVTVAGITAGDATVTGQGTYLTLTGNDGATVVNTGVAISAVEKGTLNLGSLAHANKDFTVSGAIVANTGGEILVNDATVTASGGMGLTGAAGDLSTNLTLNSGSMLKVENGLTLTDAYLLTLDGSHLDVQGGLTIVGTAASREKLALFDESSNITADALTINNAEVDFGHYGAMNVTGNGITLENSGRLDLGYDAQVTTTNLSVDATSGITTSRRNQINITVTEDFSIDPTQFMYNSLGTTFTAGKITIADNVDLMAQKNLGFTAADATNNTLDFGASNVISGNSVDVGNHGVTVVSGTLLTKGNVTGAGVLAVTGSEGASNFVVASGVNSTISSKLSASGGSLNLEYDPTAQFPVPHVIGSTINVENGAQAIAQNGISLDSMGALFVQKGTSADSTALYVQGSLEATGNSDITVQSYASLTADKIVLSGAGTTMSLGALSNFVDSKDGVHLTDGATLKIDYGTRAQFSNLTWDANSSVVAAGSGRSQDVTELIFVDDVALDAKALVFGDTVAAESGKLSLGQNVTITSDHMITLEVADAADNTLQMGSTNSITAHMLNVGTHGITLTGGSFYANGAVNGGNLVLSGGDLNLNGIDAGVLQSAITVDSLNSSLTVLSGVWTASQGITINNGQLAIEAGSLDATAGLTVGAHGSVDLGVDAGLTAQVTSLGSVNLENADKFTVSMDFANWTETATSSLTLSGTGLGAMSSAEYNAFTTEITNDLVTAGFAGVVDFKGFLLAGSLTEIKEETKAPTSFIDAGNLTFVGETIFAGISSDAPSSVKGAGVTLTLTGMGDTAGVLSKGDITVAEGGMLNLGYSDGSSQSPDKTTFEGKLIINDAEAHVNANVTFNDDVTVLNGGAFNANGQSVVNGTVTVDGAFTDLNIIGGSLTAEKVAVTNGDVAFIQVGKGNSEASESIAGELIVTGAEGITADGKATFLVQNGTVTAEKITFTGADSGAPQLTIGYANSAVADPTVTLTGADGLSLGNNADLNITAGTLNTQKLTFSELSQVNIGTHSTDVGPAVLNFTADQSFAATDFAAAKTNGKIYVGRVGTFQVDGALSITGGGEMAMADTGTIVAKGLDFAVATTLNGGNIHLMQGEGTQMLSGDLTVNQSATAASMLEVKGGTWESTGKVTISAGGLKVSAGSLDTSAGTLVVSSAAQEFSVAEGATLTVASDAFGTISSAGEFTKSDAIQKQLSNEGSLIISGLGFTTMSKAANAQLQASADWKNIVSGGGTVILDNVTMTGLYSLTHLVNGAYEEAVMAGNMAAGYDSSFTGIVKNTDEELTNSVIDAGATLSLTGKNDQALLDEGSLVNSGTLNLGHADVADAQFNGKLATDAGETNIIGKTTFNDDVTVLNGGAFNVGAQTTVNGTVTVDGAFTDLDVIGGSLTAEKLAVTNGDIAFIQVGKGNKEASEAIAGEIVVTGSEGIVLDGKATFLVQNGTVTAEKIIFSGADSGAPQLTIGFANSAAADPTVTLTGADGLGLGQNADLNITAGTLTTQKLAFSDSSQVNIGTHSSDVGPAVLNFTADQSFAAADFAAAKTNGKIYVGRVGTLQVDGSLTLTGGGEMAMADTGVITAKGFDFAAATTLKGGNIHLVQGEGTQSLRGNLTLGMSATAASNLVVQGGTWKSSEVLTVDGGNIVIDGGVLTSGINLKAGSFNIESGSFDARETAFDVSGGSLMSALDTTLMVDISTIGAKADATVAGAGTVSGALTEGLLGKVDIYGITEGTKLVYGDSTSEYGKLLVAAQGSYGNTASLSFKGIDLDLSNATLDDVIANNDNSLSGYTVKMGTGNSIAATTNIVVGGISEGEGKTLTVAGGLTITGDSADENGGKLFAGDIVVEANGVLVAGGGQKSNAAIGSVKNSGGTVKLAGQTEVATYSQSAGALTVEGGAKLHVDNFASTGGYIAIGSNVAGGQGSMTIGTLSLKDTTMTFDPAWSGVAGSDIIENASSGAIANFANGVDGHLIAGQNSYVVLGDVDTAWAQDSFNKSGLTWGASHVSSALFINTPQTLANTGSLTVNGLVTANATTNAPELGGTVLAPTANSATFADKSLLVVNAINLGNAAAITATDGILNVADTAKLHIVDGKDKQVITVATGFKDAGSVVTGAGWGNGEATDALTNLSFSSSVMGIDGPATFDATTGTYQFTLKVAFDPALYAPYMDTQTGEYLDNMIKTVGLSTTDATQAGHRFLSRALTEETYKMGTSNVKESVATIEGAAQVGALGAAAANSLGAAQAMGGAVVARNSMTGMGSNASKPVAVNMHDGQVVADAGMNAGSALQSGFGMWLMPLYKWNNVSGSEAGNLENGYNSGLGGIALGADYTRAFSKDMALRFGLAFNVGGGYSESSGDFNKTSNNFDFWGLSAYAALQKQNFVATLDMGYSSLYHDVDQEIPSSMLMGNFESDIDSEVFTVGLNLEYAFVMDFMTVTPHAGIRYMNVTTHGYDVESAGAKVASTDTEHQGVWYFPVGVTLSKDIATSNGWMFTPKLDVGFIAAAGELDAKSHTSFTGVGGAAEYELQNVDGFAFNGGLGFELANEEKGISLGLNYSLQASEHETGHMVFANFRYDF